MMRLSIIMIKIKLLGPARIQDNCKMHKKIFQVCDNTGQGPEHICCYLLIDCRLHSKMHLSGFAFSWNNTQTIVSVTSLLLLIIKTQEISSLHLKVSFHKPITLHHFQRGKVQTPFRKLTSTFQKQFCLSEANVIQITTSIH